RPNGLTTASPTHTAPVANANRPAPYNNGQRQAYNQNPNQLQGSNNNYSRPQAPAYRAPNTQMNQHSQPQQMRAPTPQAYHPQSNMQMNQRSQPQAYRPQPQQMRAPAPQQSHSEPAHNNGNGGG